MSNEVLYKTLTITLNASGEGRGSLGPSVRGDIWHIERMSTSGNSTLEPELRVYRGSDHPSNQIDITITANGDISETTTELKLWEGEFLTFVYTVGTSGSVMTARIEGYVERRLSNAFS